MNKLIRAIRFASVFAAMAAALSLSSCVSTGPEPEDGGDDGDSVLASGVRLAIFDFEVKSGVPGFEAMASDVPAALAEAFIAGGIVKPVERAALEKVIGELELSLTGLVDPGTAARIGKLAGARYVLLGTAAVVGEQVRLSCRVVDVETAEIVYAGSAFGDSDQVFEIEEELADLVQDDFSK
jgi:TolB-like protein